MSEPQNSQFAPVDKASQESVLAVIRLSNFGIYHLAKECGKILVRTRQNRYFFVWKTLNKDYGLIDGNNLFMLEVLDLSLLAQMDGDVDCGALVSTEAFQYLHDHIELPEEMRLTLVAHLFKMLFESLRGTTIDGPIVINGISAVIVRKKPGDDSFTDPTWGPDPKIKH